MLDWRTATSLYAPRVANLLLPLAGAFEEAKRLPSLPLAAPLEMEAQLALNFGLHTLNTLRATREMVHGVKENWASGRFILVTFCARLIVEYLGALSVGEKILTQYALSKDLQKAQEKAGRLIYGARSPVALPWGGTTPFKSYSAMKFVKCLDQQAPGWLETYNFLCESCHPNSLQHLWLMSIGPSHDNWSNEKFAQHGHELLDRTLSAAEKAT